MAFDQCFYIPAVDARGRMLNDPVLVKLAGDRYWVSLADSRPASLLPWPGDGSRPRCRRIRTGCLSVGGPGSEGRRADRPGIRPGRRRSRLLPTQDHPLPGQGHDHRALRLLETGRFRDFTSTVPSTARLCGTPCSRPARIWGRARGRTQCHRNRRKRVAVLRHRHHHGSHAVRGRVSESTAIWIPLRAVWPATRCARNCILDGRFGPSRSTARRCRECRITGRSRIVAQWRPG